MLKCNVRTPRQGPTPAHFTSRLLRFDSIVVHFSVLHSICDPSKMRLIQLPRRNAAGIGRQLSSTAIKSPGGASAAVSRLPVRPQKLSRSKTIFSRDGSTSTAIAVPEDVSYPTSMERKIPRDVDDVQALEALASPQAMSYCWVGLTGGQIFLDMMRRHNVKHICESSLKSSTI